MEASFFCRRLFFIKGSCEKRIHVLNHRSITVVDASDHFMGDNLYFAFQGFALLIKIFLQDSNFFLGKLFPFVNGSPSQSYANLFFLRLDFSPQDINVTFFITARTEHKPYQFIELYQSAASGTLEVEMKRYAAFHKIPEMLLLLTWFQRHLIVETKAG